MADSGGIPFIGYATGNGGGCIVLFAAADGGARDRSIGNGWPGAIVVDMVAPHGNLQGSKMKIVVIGQLRDGQLVVPM